MRCQLLVLLLMALMLLSGCVKQPRLPYENETYYLEGRVYDETNNPFEYVTVEAACKSGDTEWESIYLTESDGKYALRMVKKEGFCIINASIMDMSETEIIFLDRNSYNLDFFLKASALEIGNGSVMGYITSLSKKPLKGVIIEESFRNITTLTDDSGFYFFDDMRPGQATMVLKSDRYEIAVINARILPGQTEYINQSLIYKGKQSGGISGYVTYNKMPVENATILTLANKKILNASTDVTGYYEFNSIPVGSGYRVLAFNGSLTPGNQPVSVSSGVFTRIDFNFESNLLGAYVGGFIINSTGDPIVGAAHSLKSLSGNDYMYTDDTGYYSRGDSVYSHWPIVFDVEVSAEGYNTIKEAIVLENETYLIKNYTMYRENYE